MENPLEIVVVDDELIVRKRLKPALEKSGYNVEVYDDGSGVLKRLKEKSFDIVVTDVRMDDVDGIQVLEEVLAQSGRTKVVRTHEGHHHHRICDRGGGPGSLGKRRFRLHCQAFQAKRPARDHREGRRGPSR